LKPDAHADRLVLDLKGRGREHVRQEAVERPEVRPDGVRLDAAERAQLIRGRVEAREVQHPRVAVLAVLIKEHVPARALDARFAEHFPGSSFCVIDVRRAHTTIRGGPNDQAVRGIVAVVLIPAWGCRPSGHRTRLKAHGRPAPSEACVVGGLRRSRR